LRRNPESQGSGACLAVSAMGSGRRVDAVPQRPMAPHRRADDDAAVRRPVPMNDNEKQDPREIVITARVNGDEFDRIADAADRVGLPFSTYIRQAALGQSVTVKTFNRLHPAD